MKWSSVPIGFMKKNTTIHNSDFVSQHVRGEDHIMIDLRGLTKEQSLRKLDSNESLPQWVEIAMKDYCLLAVHFKIICGAGKLVTLAFGRRRM